MKIHFCIILYLLTHIDIDFENIYSGKENFLFEKWPFLIPKLLTLMHTNIKDSNSRELLKKLCNQNSEIDLVYVYSKNTATNSKRIIKTSIAGARNSFLLLCANTSDLYTKIQNKVDSYYEKKQTLQLLIWIIGDEYMDSKEFFIYYFNTYYKFPNIVKAVDLCFKIFNYPIQSELAWTFLQKYFYDIHTEFDVKSSALISLMSDLSN
ncbi:Uncharacterized protein FWK35_00017877 [Aphis craccivora]|uniref:Uncharacterized protein n=1 Tax=Aphis craccivora TaxID=307492 RepID=A0A6G0XU90_APHCR|nr:Uncharacterized protein FWK35_00017877 [Aphis craccivora]